MHSLIHLEKELLSLSKQLESISKGLENHRDFSIGDREARYDHIKILARKYPIRNTKLRAAHELTKKAYFGLLTLLSTIAQQDHTEDQRLFLQRIAAGTGYTLEFEEWMKARKMIEEELENGNTIHLEENTYSLLLDSLLLINLTGGATVEAWRMLAELSIVLNIAQGDLEMLAQLARSIIHQNEEEFNSIKATDPLKWRGMFTHHIPAAWMKNGRVYCGGYEEMGRNVYHFMNTPLKIISKMQEKSFANKGDVIVKYIENGKEINILAPKAGSVSYLKEVKNRRPDGSWKKESTKVFIKSCFDEPDTPNT
ncbi:hypothetical protein [Paenibacillus sp.]|uniref:hypothetical protein n=1 Tax=Paenibacillus sp. TaxID=58172 RepID=UPI0028A875D1|nr:hypothetical protein [Paenibacillus sp.]